MNDQTAVPARPALRYYGGKWNLASWIISHFPAHANYVEPCGGAASVLLQKTPSPVETYNDLDTNVVNFFRVLRDRRDELISKINLTPWARAEYELSLEPCADDVERARRFFVACWMSYGGHPSGWRMTTDVNTRWSPASSDIVNHDLLAVAKRLITVQIENRDALEVMERYDNKSALIYFDPPYVLETRAMKDKYLIEVDNPFHVKAAEILRHSRGMVIVSGYACPLYTELYETHGWIRRDRKAQTNSGGERIESLWLSPRTYAALQDEHRPAVVTQMGLWSAIT